MHSKVYNRRLCAAQDTELHSVGVPALLSSAGVRSPAAVLLQQAAGAVLCLAGGAAPPAAWNTALLADLGPCHQKHAEEDGGPARRHCRVQPALWIRGTKPSDLS